MGKRKLLCVSFIAMCFAPTISALDLGVIPGDIERAIIFETVTGQTLQQVVSRDTAMYPLVNFELVPSSHAPTPTLHAFAAGFAVSLEGDALRLTSSTRSIKTTLTQTASPTAIAVSERGDIVIAEATKLRRFSPDLEEKVAPVCAGCVNITRVAYDDDEIFIFDRARGDLLTAKPNDAKFSSIGSFTTLKMRASDVAVYRGVIYICGEQSIVVGTRASMTFTHARLPNVSDLRRVAVTSNRLYLLDGETRLFVRPRLTQAALRFDGNAETTNAGLTRLYEYFLKRSMLSVKRVEATARYVTLADLLVGEGALASAPKPGAAYLDNLEALLRRINTNLDILTGPEIMTRPLAMQSTLTLPDLGVRITPWVDQIPVGKPEFERFVKTGFWVEPSGDRSDPKYLAILNNVRQPETLQTVAVGRGYLLTPSDRIRARVLAPAQDLRDPASELRLLLAEYKVKYLPGEEGTVSGSSCMTPDSALEESLTVATENRNLLRKRIDFPAAAVPRTPWTIAIAEEAESTDRTHPDFFTGDGRSIWRRGNGRALGVDDVRMQNGTRTVREFRQHDDHGTHVAGILAAQGQTVPGLVSDSHLYLLNITNPVAEQLDEEIGTSIGRGIRLFNFSNTITAHDATWDVIGETILSWSSFSLFVVAAGNEGMELQRPATIGIPLRWASYPNVIGVGAANGCDDILGDVGRGPVLAAGSNYGSTYVHLIAPGLDIYSCARGAAYASACGTSDAAPQVTAAAAALMQSRDTEASLVKARLIYTADWRSQYLRKVAGGQLNVRRALSHLERNVLVLESAPQREYDLVFDKLAPGSVVWKPKQALRAQGDSPLPADVPFRDVLRLHRQSNGLYRMIYLEYPALGQPTRARPRMRTLYNVNIDVESTIPCVALSRIDGDASEIESASLIELCGKGILTSQLIDYVGAIPPSPVEFE